MKLVIQDRCINEGNIMKIEIVNSALISTIIIVSAILSVVILITLWAWLSGV